MSYFPTFPTKWQFFLLLSYFSRFCPTFLLFLRFSLRNAPKMPKSTYMLQFSIKTAHKKIGGAMRLSCRLSCCAAQISKIPTFLVQFLLFSENPTKFLLNFVHSYHPTFKTPKELDTQLICIKQRVAPPKILHNPSD